MDANLLVTLADQEDPQGEGDYPQCDHAYDPQLPAVSLGREKSDTKHQYATTE
jgi:hypothetical protein